MSSSILVKNIHAGYGAVRVLHDVSVELRDQETVVLLGANGNGKSTLIKCLMGLVRPESGEITLEIDGQTENLIGKSTQQIVQLGVTLVPEGRRLFPKLSVEDNLLLGAFRAEARKNIRRNMELCFETFPRLATRREQLAGSMSGGEQQMLAVGRALMSSPRILLVDEPSVGLAPIFVTELIRKIDELRRAYNLTVLMAEQNFMQATKIADRGYIIVEGKIEFSGTNQDLLEHGLVKRYYLGA